MWRARAVGPEMWRERNPTGSGFGTTRERQHKSPHWVRLTESESRPAVDRICRDSGVGRWHDAPVATLDEATIARLLLQHWDVLGVAASDVGPENEYLPEAAEVLALLRIGSGYDEIAAYLGRAADDLHANPDVERDQRAAASICEAHRE